MSYNFKGRKVEQAKSNAPKLRARSNYQFYYMHHPNGWEALETDQGFEWLPVLRTFKMKPGLNGVRMGRNGPDISIAKARFEGDGWKILEYDAHEGGYLQKFDGINGPIFADVWTSPRTLGIGVHSSVLWEKDRDGFNDFRRSLVEKGIISPPDPAVIGAKARLQSKRAGRRINEAHIPHVAKKIDAEAKKLEFMEGTKPKKKTRKAKPKATKAANDGK